MTTETRIDYLLVPRSKTTGELYGGNLLVPGATYDYAFPAPSAEECAKRAAIGGVGNRASWRPISWKKAQADGFWNDPRYVMEYTEEPPTTEYTQTPTELFVMKRTWTRTTDSTSYTDSVVLEYLPDPDTAG